MADLKARLIKGDRFSAEDTIELDFTYDGDAHSCVQHIEIVSGETVTHGGGATAETTLHYKAHERHDGSTDEVDGVIDYKTTEMNIVQTAKGTTVIKVVANLLLKSTMDAYDTAYQEWYDAYAVQPESEEGLQLIAGAPNPPAYPEATQHKSGEITLEWTDDTFV
jgi:hypothetical protein